MKRLVVTACMFISAGILIAACASNDLIPDTVVSDATSAIQELEDQDREAVDGCRRAIDICGEDGGQDASFGVCDRLSSHCGGLNEDLGRVRGPAVGCWRGVEACDASSKADCEAMADRCDRFDDDIDAGRRPVLDCSKIVERCLAESEAAGETGEVCDAVAEACEAVGDLSADAEDARARGDERADDMCRDAHDAIPTIPEHGNNDGDIDIEDGDNDDEEVSDTDGEDDEWNRGTDVEDGVEWDLGTDIPADIWTGADEMGTDPGDGVRPEMDAEGDLDTDQTLED